MITGFFLSAFFQILQFIVGFLPFVAFPVAISAGIITFWSYVNLFSMVVPVQTILTVMLLMFFYLGVKLLWSSMHWLLRRFRR